MKKTLYVMSAEHGDQPVEFDDAEVTSEAYAEARALFERVKAEGGHIMNVVPGGEVPAQKVERFEDIGEEAVVFGRVVGG